MSGACWGDLCPLFELAGKALSNRLSSLHQVMSNMLIGLVVLHIAAIGFYGHFKKQKLLRPMFTGWQEGEAASARGGFVALIVALIIAGAAIYGASGVWLAELPPPPAAETPNW